MTRRATPDGDLVAAARGGDRRAFAALVERHYGVLVATCRRATGDAELAADAAQEAVVTALVGLDRLREPERFGAWLIGIGLNLCRRALQERARWARADGVEPPAPGPGPHEAAEAAQIAERVHAAIAALPAAPSGGAARPSTEGRESPPVRDLRGRRRANCVGLPPETDADPMRFANRSRARRPPSVPARGPPQDATRQTARGKRPANGGPGGHVAGRRARGGRLPRPAPPGGFVV